MSRCLTIAAAVLALPLAAIPVGAQVIPAPAATAAEGAILDVTAEGRSQRVPDLAIIRAGIVTQSATAVEAMAENARRMAGVRAALTRAGVAARDIQTASVSLNPQYVYQQNEPPRLTGYQASNTLSIRFRDIARAGAILDALVREGANSIDGPTLTLDQPEAAMDEARTDAMRRARARAELYARAAGMRVDRILFISETGSAPPPMPVPVMRMQAATAEADTSIAAGEQTLTASVTVRFLLR